MGTTGQVGSALTVVPEAGRNGHVRAEETAATAPVSVLLRSTRTSLASTSALVTHQDTLDAAIQG